MAEFLEQKCHVADTMSKKSRDEVDEDERRRRVIADANRIVSGKWQPNYSRNMVGWGAACFDELQNQNGYRKNDIWGVTCRELIILHDLFFLGTIRSMTEFNAIISSRLVRGQRLIINHSSSRFLSLPLDRSIFKISLLVPSCFIVIVHRCLQETVYVYVYIYIYMCVYTCIDCIYIYIYIRLLVSFLILFVN